MNRTLFVFTLSVLAGILFPNQQMLVAVVLILLSLSVIAGVLIKKRLFFLPVLLGWLFGLFVLQPAMQKESALLPFAENPVACTVEVASKPQINDTYTKFNGIVLSVNGTPVREKTVFYVYGKTAISENTVLTVKTAKIKQPAEQQNFNGFDYRRYLKSKRIYTTMSAKADAVLNVAPCKMNVRRLAIAANSFLCDKADAMLETEPAALLKGILLGDKSSMSEDTIDNFRNSGLSHVLAVSGLHLTVLVSILGVFLKRAPRRLRLPLLLAAIWGFAFLVGLPVSVIRAAVMLSLLLIAQSLRWESDALTDLALAALLLLVYEPNTVYDTGFILSFSATLGILCIYPTLARCKPHIMPAALWDNLFVSLSAQIGTLPFMVLCFGQISWISLLGNLLISVLLPVIYAAVLLAYLLPCGFMVSLANGVLYALQHWAKFCANIPFAGANLPHHPLLLVGVFGITTVCLFASAYRRARLPALLLTVFLLTTALGWLWGTQPPQTTQITFINVGQADCALIRTPNGDAFLIDAGTEYAAQNEVLPYLAHSGITHLNGIFVSHFDSDHAGGLTAVLDALPTQAVFIPDTADVGQEQYNFLQYAKNHAVNVLPLSVGERVETESIAFSVLAPTLGLPDGNNNSSLVVRADNADVSALFTGDLEDESKLENCNADILKVSHHGSANGSNEAFLKNCTPKIAVISLGLHNMYGFPKQEVLERLAQYTNRIYRTDLCGTVRINCDKKHYTVSTLR